MNHFLQILKLGNNEITNDGATIILNSLSFNKTIKTIILSGNKIDQKIISEIEKKLISNKESLTKSNSPIKESKDSSFVTKPKVPASPPFISAKTNNEKNIAKPYDHLGDYESDKLLRDFRNVDTRYRSLLSDYEILKRKYDENQFHLPIIDHSKMEISKLEGIIEKLNADVLLKDERIESLSFELASKHKNELILIQNDMLKLKNELDLTRKNLMIKDDEISKMRYDYEQNLVTYTSRIKILENDNSKLVNEIQINNDKYRKEMERYHSQILSLEHELEKERNEFQSLDALNKKISFESSERIKEIETQLLFQKDENEKLKIIYDSTIIKVKQLEELEIKFPKLLEENEKLKCEIKSLDEVCIKNEDEMNKIVKEVNDSRVTIQTLLSQTNILENESKNLLIDNENLKRSNLNFHKHVKTHCKII